MNVAYIGLGKMGAAMATRIARAGIDLTVFARTQSKMAPLVALGAHPAESIGAAVREADVVITSLTDDNAVLSVVQDHLLGAMRPAAIHVGTTTNSPQCAEQVAKLHQAAGTQYVAGPVLGRPEAIEAGKLLTYLAGSREAVDAVKPVCLAYAAAITYLGERHSTANALKLCFNYFAVAFIETLGEVYSFGDRLGVDTVHLKDFIEKAMANQGLKNYAENIFRRNFDAGFSMDGGLKDVRLMRDAAAAAGASLEIGAIAERKMLAAIQKGMTQMDWSATYEITRQEMGLK